MSAYKMLYIYTGQCHTEIVPPIDRWPHIRCTYLISKTEHNEDLNIINNEHNDICHTRASQDITYNNADTIQEHLDEQEHIWNITSRQNRTSSSNVAHSMKKLPIYGTSSSARHPSKDTLQHQKSSL